MPYADFTLERVEAEFGLTADPRVCSLTCRQSAVPRWLTDVLARGRRAVALIREKVSIRIHRGPDPDGRSGVRDRPVAIYSGQGSTSTRLEA